MRKLYNLLLLLAVATVVYSCHSTEANYKDSYDKAVAASRTGEKGEQYIQELSRRTHKNIEVDGDSIRKLSYHFNIVDDKSEVIKQYGVVVAEFKQKFNAISCRDRLRKEEGLQSYVVYIASQKLYCVIAQGYEDLSVAATFAKNPQKYMHMKLLVPMAWVLEQPNRKR